MNKCTECGKEMTDGERIKILEKKVKKLELELVRFKYPLIPYIPPIVIPQPPDFQPWNYPTEVLEKSG